MRRISTLILLVSCWTVFAWSQGANISAILGYPQTIYYNAKIVTVSDAGFTNNLGPVVQAMAIRDKKILHMGSNAEVRALAGPQTQQIDLKGRTVVPGFITVHNHPNDWVHSAPKIMKKVIPDDVMVLRYMNGTPQQMMEELPKTLEAAVKVAKPGFWIEIVLLWDIIASPDDPYIRNWAGKHVTKEMLDRLAPNNPVQIRARPMILSQDLTAIMNQKAIEEVRKEVPAYVFDAESTLKLAEQGKSYGATVATRDIERGYMFKGHLDLLTEALRLDLQWWAAHGQTTYGTALYHHPDGIKAFSALDRKGQMDNRMAWGYGGTPEHWWEETFKDPFFVADLATREGTGTDYMWYLGTGEPTGTCVSITPLPNRPKDVSLVMQGGGCQGSYDKGGVLWNALYPLIRDGGRLIGSHQFGDVDVDNIFRLITEASKDAGFTPEQIRAKRHTADHMQGWPRPDQIPVIKNLGMVVGGTNLYIHQDSYRWMRDYGEKALEMVVPRRSMINAGIMNGIEIDKPYEASEKGENVFTYLDWSIRRKGQDGKVYLPNQRLSREEALKTATIWGAYYVLKEKVLGSLERGKFADFLVLDKDYLTVPEDQIPTIRVMMTVVGDKVVHLVPSLARELGMQPKGAAVELGGPQASY